MDVLAGFLILLITAKILGELVAYAGYPSLIGEVIAGILLGPSVFNLVAITPIIQFCSTLGVILLLFITGVEINQKIFRSVWGRMIVTGLAAAVIPFVIGYALGTFFALPPGESTFIAIVFMLTSIGVSAQTLIEERQLNTDIGMTIVGGAVVCAICGIIIFAILSSVKNDGSLLGQYTLFLPLIIAVFFILVIATIGKRLFRFIYDRTQAVHNHTLTYTVVFLIACISAYFSQSLGLTVVVGAFFAGITLNTRIHEDHEIHDSLHNMAFGILITLFFANVGLLMNIPYSDLFAPITLIVIVVAILAKVIGGFLGSYPFFKNRAHSFIVGIGMIPRGDLTLALAQSAIVAGIISQQIYTATVLLVLVTVLLTPLFLKIGLTHLKNDTTSPEVTWTG